MPEKLAKYLHFYYMCATNLKKNQILHGFCPKSAGILHNYCQKKYFFTIFGGGTCPPPPVSNAYGSSWESRLTAMERHPPYGITHCYLPPDTNKRAQPTGKPVLGIPTPEGWKAELTYRLPGNAQAGVKPAIFRSQVRRPNHYTTEPPMHLAGRRTDGNWAIEYNSLQLLCHRNSVF